MASEKNYYDILGVSKTATPDEIKKAYRNMAREHHPDMVKDGAKHTAEQRFKEINEAYQVLSDPEKRRMYDQFGSAGPNAGPSGFGGGAGGQWGPFNYSYTTQGNSGFGDFDPFDVFAEVFGSRGFGGRGRAPQKGKNLYYEMHLEFIDALKGFEREVQTESGKVKVKVPSGVRDGTEMRFAGKGMPGPNNLPAGDLFLTFRVRIPSEFQVLGNSLGVALELPYVQAALGDTVEVPVVDLDSKNGVGTAKLKIPAGTQHGAQFRLRGKGLPIVNSSSTGDVTVQVFITIPTKLSKEQRKHLEELKKLD